MAKQTFIPRDAQNNPIGAPVAFTPLIVIAGNVTHKLALHRECNCLPERMKGWSVSHPAIGARVIEVRAWFKGCPVTSAHLTAKTARQEAVNQIDALLERIGTDKFNEIIASQTDKGK